MSNIGPEIASALISLQVEVANEQIDAAAVKAATEFNKVFANTQKALAARDKASQAAAAASIAQAFGGMAKSLDIVTPKISAFQKLQTAVTVGVNRFGTSMTAAAGGVIALSTAAVILTKRFAGIAGNFQELEQGINAIIENSSTAATTTEKFIGSLRSLALQSGRSSEQLANTGRQFLALGFSGDETTKILETFTKAAALTGATNQQLSLALAGVSQIASKGAVSMEELRRQIAENLPGAVNLNRFFELLGKNMGITESEARKLQQQGLVKADIGIKTLLQTVNETTEGIDVFALRAKTLNGLMGILKEGFTQAVQTGFRPFIDAVTKAASGPLGQLIGSLQSGSPAISGFTELIERFGKVIGDTFVKVLNNLLPLLPGLANGFVTLIEAISPIIVEFSDIANTIGRVLVPAINIAAIALRILFNDLGPVSSLLTSLAAGAILTGIVNGFALFGRALGSVGGLLGRIATPLTGLFKSFATFAGPIGEVTAALGIFGNLLNPIISSVANLRTAFISLAVALLAINAQSIIGFFTQLIPLIGRLALTAKATTIAVGGLKNALLLSGAAVAAGVAINSIISDFQKAKNAADELKESLVIGIQPNSLDSLKAALAQAEAELEKQRNRFGARGGIQAGIVGVTQLITPAANTVINAQAALVGVSSAVDQLRQKLGAAQGLLDAVFAQTGASAKQVNTVLSDLGIDITKLVGADVPGLITKIVSRLKEGTTAAKSFITQLNEGFQKVLSDTNKLESAQKAVDTAQQTRLTAIKAEADARQDVADAIQAETEAKEKLNEITEKLVKLESDRAKLVADTARDIREIADAQRDVESIGFRLLDLDSRRLDILDQIAQLQGFNTADAIVSADNRITRAKITLNRAIQDEIDLNKELNAEQETSVDLSGLTLDQLRTRLAGIRLSLAAQRSITKSGKTQQEIEDDITEAHLNTVDAQINLNQAVQARADLDVTIIQNQRDLADLARTLKQIENDKAGLLDDQVEANEALAKLQSGETTRLGEIKKLDEEIKNLRIDQRNATVDVQKATADIQAKQDLIKSATLAIRDAEKEIRDAKAEQRLTVATILGNEQEINRALLDRIGLNTTLSDQTSRLLAQQIITILPNDPIISGQISNIVGAPLSIRGQANPQFANKLADLILNNPNKLRDLLRTLGITGFEQGGMVTHPMFATIGEKFKHEMILPMTKPDRVWQLMSQNLPRYPKAFAAAQKAISPSSIASIPKPVNIGSKRVVPRDEGPATYGQIQELIRVLSEQRTEVHVDAPITVENVGSDQLLLKKLSRQLKREILGELGKR